MTPRELIAEEIQRVLESCLEGILKSQRVRQRLMTEQEICEYLRISREGVFALRNREVDPIPHGMAGRRYVYHRDKVDKWTERQARMNKKAR